MWRDAPERRVSARNGSPELPGGGALNAWRERPDVSAILTEFELFAHGSGLDSCPALGALVGKDSLIARDFSEGFVLAALQGLASVAAVPSEEPSGGHGDVEVEITALERARLYLSIHHCPTGPGSDHVIALEPLECWHHIIRGTGEAERTICLDPGQARSRMATEYIPVRAGTTCHRLGVSEALTIRAQDGAIAELRLERSFRGALPVRHYHSRTGRLAREERGDIQSAPAGNRLVRLLAIGSTGAASRVHPLVRRFARMLGYRDDAVIDTSSRSHPDFAIRRTALALGCMDPAIP